MLVKWALKKTLRRSSDVDPAQSPREPPRTPLEPPPLSESPVCMESFPAPEGAAAISRESAQDTSAPVSHSSSLDTHQDVQEDRDKYASASTVARSTETENTRTMRRVEAEEKAIYLRDNKLLSVADNPRQPQHGQDQTVHHAGTPGPTHALTQENIDRLTGREERGHVKSVSGNFSGSMDVQAQPEGQETSEERSRGTSRLRSRPSLFASRKHESEQTVTASPESKKR